MAELPAKGKCIWKYCLGNAWSQRVVSYDLHDMMKSSNGNIFRVTDPLWGESTGHWWIPLPKSSDTELWYFLWSAAEQTIEQTIETPVMLEAVSLTMMYVQFRHCYAFHPIGQFHR